MEDKKILIESLFEKIKEYLSTSIELLRLKAIEKASEAFSTLAVRLSIIFVFSLFFLFLNIGLALWFGDLLGKLYYGFFIVSGFYILIAALFLLYHKQIKKSIADAIVTHLFK